MAEALAAGTRSLPTPAGAVTGQVALRWDAGLIAALLTDRRRKA
jgi:hypothetical protein